MIALSVKVVLVELRVVVVPVTLRFPPMVVVEALIARVLLADPRVTVPAFASVPRRREVFPWMVVVVGHVTEAVPEAYVDVSAALPPDDVKVALPVGSRRTAPADPLMVVDPALMVKVLLAAPKVIVPVVASAPRDKEVAPTIDVVNPLRVVVLPVAFP